MADKTEPPQHERTHPEEPWPPRQAPVTIEGPREEEEMRAEPASFPEGFWRRLDYMLHHPESILESLRRDLDVWRMSEIFLVIALAMAAIYGAVMGATNLLQASAMETGGKLLMVLASAIKVPALFLLTLVIVLPPVYVANTLVGPRLGFPRVLTVLLASVALTAAVLASTATVAFFFALTSRSYHFIKLLHVVFFVYAGIVGLRFFQKCIRAVTPLPMRGKLKRLFLGTLVLYVFVGTQLAWVLRPFVGDPGMEFQVFRPRKGNFYESVWHSTRRVLEQQFGRRRPAPAVEKQPGDTAPDSAVRGD
jgi:hypothetical protein